MYYIQRIFEMFIIEGINTLSGGKHKRSLAFNCIVSICMGIPIKLIKFHFSKVESSTTGNDNCQKYEK